MYLGLDLGTSSVKALLINESQQVVASQTAPLDVSRPEPGWSEQNPSEWWRAITVVLDELAETVPAHLAATRGIGLSGQMHGATLLDAADNPLRPCILWNDGRASVEAAELSDASVRVTGNLAMPGFTAPKLLWVERHEPATFARTETVLLPKDYIRLMLTGEKASDMSDAAGTLWLATAERKWSDEMLSLTCLDRSHMPRLVEGTDVTGKLLPSLASRWGMSRDVVVAGGGGDNAASGAGVGAVSPGTGFISLGTSGVIFITTDQYRANAASAVHTFCHAVPDSWHQMGVTLSAADSLEWLARITGVSPSCLLGELGNPAEPSAIRFLPYLSGERTPHNDVAVRGAFVGLDHRHGCRDLTQAVIEGVAFSLKDCLDALTAPLAPPRQLIAVGGGSRSRSWLSVLATVLDLPIAVPADGSVGAAFGAARLGLTAAEHADPFEICGTPEIRETIEPIPALAEAYASAHAEYRELYPALKNAVRQ